MFILCGVVYVFCGCCDSCSEFLCFEVSDFLVWSLTRWLLGFAKYALGYGFWFCDVSWSVAFCNDFSLGAGLDLVYSALDFRFSGFGVGVYLMGFGVGFCVATCILAFSVGWYNTVFWGFEPGWGVFGPAL